jgi:demethylmenaquinone methyltransferase/2-methoxy-6-polyprenyl-1,4-benzoquinol methylase
MDKSKASIQEMFSGLAKCYDSANSVLSLGLHFVWKKALINTVLKSKDKELVLDLCSGTGDIQLALRKHNVNTIAADFTFAMLAVQSQRQESSDRLLQADALCLPFQDKTFSIVTVAYGVRNFECLESGLKEIFRVLKEDGKLLVLEFGDPSPGFMGYCVKTYEKVIVPLIGRLLFRKSKAYSYLSKTAGSFPAREDFLKVAMAQGYSNGKFKELFFGASYLYEITKESPRN